MNYEGVDERILKAFEKWRPKIYAWARKLNLRNEFDLEDLEQDIITTLMWALGTYDSSKRTSFDTWAYSVLQSYFVNRLQSMCSKKSGKNKIVVEFEEVYDLGTEKKSDVLEFEDLLKTLQSYKLKVIASVLMEKDNEYSEPFWYSFYKKRDELLNGIRFKSKGRLRISVNRELKDFLKISKGEYEELCKDISSHIGEIY